MTITQRTGISHAQTAAAMALAVLAFTTLAVLAATIEQSPDTVAKIVAHIQRADYEGNRAALKSLYDELPPAAGDNPFAARVLYWRGFALWRRAINGFNDSVDSTELEADLRQALEEFIQASSKDPGFVDAKIGALSCVSLLAFSVNQKDPERIQGLIAQGRQLRKEAEAAAPENPRLLWVMGPNVWFAPAERGGGQAKAMEMYQKGLEAFRKPKPLASDALDPTWGEPELLMSLAWSNLNRTTPDLNAAEHYANAALKIVPYWHYVRDILVHQIQDARPKQKP